MKILLAMGLVLSSASAVAAQAPRSNDAVICRTSANDTGSRLARTRVCRTREQWAADRREQRQALDRAQNMQLNRTIDERGRLLRTR
jgi:hypothetical protein